MKLEREDNGNNLSTRVCVHWDRHPVAGASSHVCLRSRGNGLSTVSSRRRQAEWEDVLSKSSHLYVDGVEGASFD